LRRPLVREWAGRVRRPAQASRTGVRGIVDWDVRRDPPAAARLREIVRNGLR
jgi:hypothetical protein